MNAKYALALILTLQGKKHIDVIWRNSVYGFSFLMKSWLFCDFVKNITQKTWLKKYLYSFYATMLKFP